MHPSLLRDINDKKECKGDSMETTSYTQNNWSRMICLYIYARSLVLKFCDSEDLFDCAFCLIPSYILLNTRSWNIFIYATYLFFTTQSGTISSLEYRVGKKLAIMININDSIIKFLTSEIYLILFAMERMVLFPCQCDIWFNFSNVAFINMVKFLCLL